MRWRFLDTGVRDGPLNMAIDEAILRSVAAGTGPPTLRLYGWHPPCLSLGYFQSLEAIDVEACRRKGVDIVRRITGGRSLLHHREVTYSIILPERNPLLPEGVLASYETISRGLKAGLERIGLHPESAGRGKRKEVSSAACFDAPSWYELRIGKRKIAGSAQTRKRGVLLQHGSLPLELDGELLHSLLAFSTPGRRERARRRFLRRATAINPALRDRGRPAVNRGAVQRALVAGMRETLDLGGEWGELSAAERGEAEHLRAERYACGRWTEKR